MRIVRSPQPGGQVDVDPTQTYDAIVIGSGAAGGMAAPIMPSPGMEVLMLGASKELEIEKELKLL